LAYASPAASFRVGQSGPADVPSSTGGTPTSYAISPALPAGLSMDLASGVLSGSPSAPSSTSPFTVTASNADGSTQASITVQATPALPAEFLTLAAGFSAEKVQGGLASPDKIAFAPDGRLFFNELSAGNTRIIDAAGALLPAPFSSMTVLSQ